MVGFQYDLYLIKKPCEAPSGLAWRGRLIANLNVSLTHSRRRELHQVLCQWLMRGDSHHQSRLRGPRRGSRRNKAAHDECDGQELLQHRVKGDGQSRRTITRTHRLRKRVGLKEAQHGRHHRGAMRRLASLG